MILKCGKTGRLFFSTADAEEHAEAFGKEYANFEEVSQDTKVWICVETGRQVYAESEIARIKARDPDSKTWEEKNVAYLIQLQKKKEEAGRRKDRFFASVNQKKLENLSMLKGHNRSRSAKALHFTKDVGTIEAAEKWIDEHSGDADVDKLTEEFLDSVATVAGSGSGDVVMADADADVVMADAADDRKPGDPNPPEIKEKVNQELLKQVMEMGFEEMKAEKALYKTDNASLMHAVNWLGDHEKDADIDLPLKKPPRPPPEKPKMSKEEAEAKARELQEKIKLKRMQDEKLSEKEKERMRVESTKMMAEAKQRQTEEDAKRAIEERNREKEEHEKHKAELKERLRQDYIERFGCEPPDEKENEEKALKEKSSKDQVAHWLSKLKKTYKDENPEGLKVCLSTLKLYIKNLADNPQDPKFKKLKLDNKAFQSRIAPYEGAVEFLDVMGFEKKADCLEQRKSIPDGWLAGNALKFIDLILGQI